MHKFPKFSSFHLITTDFASCLFRLCYLACLQTTIERCRSNFVKFVRNLPICFNQNTFCALKLVSKNFHDYLFSFIFLLKCILILKKLAKFFTKCVFLLIFEIYEIFRMNGDNRVPVLISLTPIIQSSEHNVIRIERYFLEYHFIEIFSNF